MINKVVCRSFADMAEYYPNRADNDIFISAMDIGATNPIFGDSDTSIALNWLDCGGYHSINHDCGHFPKEYAERIVEFIQRFHIRPEAYTLNLNCMLGRSRSGAIGFFAWQYCGLDFQIFLAGSPQVNPNKHVLKDLWAQI